MGEKDHLLFWPSCPVIRHLLSAKPGSSMRYATPPPLDWREGSRNRARHSGRPGYPSGCENDPLPPWIASGGMPGWHAEPFFLAIVGEKLLSRPAGPALTVCGWSPGDSMARSPHRSCEPGGFESPPRHRGITGKRRFPQGNYRLLCPKTVSPGGGSGKDRGRIRKMRGNARPLSEAPASIQ